MEATIGRAMGTTDRQPDRIPPSWFGDPDPAVRSQAASGIGRAAYLFALQMTRQPDIAQDIAQDSLVKFYRGIDRFDPSRPVEPWLYSIVRNQARDQARRDRHRRHDSLDAWLDAGLREVADDAAEPSEVAEMRERQRMVWTAIGELSDDHREILVLRDFHDLTYDELASTLGNPRGTVMSRLHAARARLRQRIQASHLDTEQREGGGIDG